MPEKRFGQVALFHNIESGLKFESPASLKLGIVPPAFYQDTRLKRYSENTQKSYAGVLTRLLKYWQGAPLENIAERQIRECMVYLVDQLQCSDAY